jgi:hypothetical protein
VWTNYAKDKFFAPEISSLVAPSAPSLRYGSSETGSWLGTFVLNCATRFRIADPERQLIYTLIRRADAAVLGYEEGSALLSGIHGATPQPSLRTYSRCLMAFEHSVAATFHALRLLRQLHPHKPQLFVQQDASVVQRLDRVYNAVKHADDLIGEGGRFAKDSTLAVWLVNDGMRCVDARLSFNELHAEIDDVGLIARHFALLEDLPPSLPAGDVV